MRNAVKQFGWGTFKIISSVTLGFFAVFAVVGFAGASYVYVVSKSLPGYDELVERDVPESSKIYSRDGTLLYEFHGEFKRTTVGFDQISTHLKNATLAIEDKDFYNHGAVSLTGIARALMTNYQTGSVVQGGSTITQQFAKNALLNRDKLFSRKVREVLLSYKIESHFSKDEILELYLNEIPYGRNAYGAEAAAQTYYNKNAKDLTLAEAAYLAALPQAPSYLSPTGANFEALENRKNLILDEMQRQGYINEQDRDGAKGEKVAFKSSTVTIIAPHFVSWVQNYLTEKYGHEFLQEGGLKVYTTLDLKLQALAEQAVKEGAAINAKKYRAYNAALVAVEPSTGKILAMAGGKDYFGKAEPAGCIPGKNCKFEPNVNVATALRQPGSSFKPYAYLTAFKPEHGYTPLSRILDTPTVFGYSGGRAYIPRNYDGSSHGWITMRKALAGSLNVPAVKTLALVGVEDTVQTARDIGITAPLKNCGLTLVLGGCEIELVDHVSAFSVIANGGKGTGGTPFLRIEDKRNNILEEYQPATKQSVNPEAVYSLISIMTDDLSRQYVFGRDNVLNLPDRVVAAKTGTTQNWKDGWTLGFTPQLSVGVWTGNNDGSLMAYGADGSFTAGPIWQKFMIEAHKGLPAMDFQVPSGIIQIAYDQYTNRPATNPNARNVRMEPFAWYALPKDTQVSAAPRTLRNIIVPTNNPPTQPTASEPQTSTIQSSPMSYELPPLSPAGYYPAPTETTTTPSSPTTSPTDYGGVSDSEAPTPSNITPPASGALPLDFSSTAAGTVISRTINF